MIGMNIVFYWKYIYSAVKPLYSETSGTVITSLDCEVVLFQDCWTLNIR